MMLISAAVIFFFAMPDAHVRSDFQLTVNLPYDQAFPLFGAWIEQKWAPDWKPQFIYPDPPVDREGAVFLVSHRSHSAVWTLTRFDAETGRVQYVYVMDKVMLTRIDIHLARNGRDKTDVAVAYERTALDPDAAAHVQSMGKHDAESGPEWEAALNAYAERARHGGK